MLTYSVNMEHMKNAIAKERAGLLVCQKLKSCGKNDAPCNSIHRGKHSYTCSLNSDLNSTVPYKILGPFVV